METSEVWNASPPFTWSMKLDAQLLFAMVSIRRVIGCSSSVLASNLTGAVDGFPLLRAKSG
jgi:hypothetical protein